MQRKEEEWQPVPSSTTTGNNTKFYTPATTTYEKPSTNPYDILDQSEEIEEKDEKDKISTQLSHKFNENIETPGSNKSSLESNPSSSKSITEVQVLDHASYARVTKLIRKNRQDEISMDKFEL